MVGLLYLDALSPPSARQQTRSIGIRRDCPFGWLQRFSGRASKVVLLKVEKLWKMLYHLKIHCAWCHVGTSANTVSSKSKSRAPWALHAHIYLHRQASQRGHALPAVQAGCRHRQTCIPKACVAQPVPRGVSLSRVAWTSRDAGRSRRVQCRLGTRGAEAARRASWHEHPSSLLREPAVASRGS